MIRVFVDVEKFTVRFTIRPEFARFQVEGDVKEICLDHVAIDSDLQVVGLEDIEELLSQSCLLYTSPSPRD